MKKGGSRTPSSLTSFHFSPVFLRSTAGGGGGLSLVSPPPGVRVPRPVHCASQRVDGRGQAGRWGGSDAFGILTGVDRETGGRTERTHFCPQKSLRCSEALCDI